MIDTGNGADGLEPSAPFLLPQSKLQVSRSIISNLQKQKAKEIRNNERHI
jgi:hypothetical protein